jgi:hypothetical protein
MKAGAAVERVYISWTNHWEMDQYVDHYLTSRHYAVTAEARAAIRKLISHIKTRPLKKADLDFFLDANVGKKLKLEKASAKNKKK